jgi:hypothetical protein
MSQATPSDFDDYQAWAFHAVHALGLTPSGQYGVWRVWWRERIGMPDPLRQCVTRSTPDEEAA